MTKSVRKSNKRRKKQCKPFDYYIQSPGYSVRRFRERELMKICMLDIPSKGEPR